ncbi:hypothetical protein HHK36_027300 [Tetracentron sinense]|uniref:Uncharacterized protein n=1 Tax=Tetracentron sinense TaxID=13715 RepID=A0A835D2X1_TETSI|nr:hypothetical protein HHK36_027300 [Tetracentron sinense]
MREDLRRDYELAKFDLQVYYADCMPSFILQAKSELLVSVDSCPVNDIHWVDGEELAVEGVWHVWRVVGKARKASASASN